MPVHTTTQTFPDGGGHYEPDQNDALLIVQANGGSVTVAALMADDTAITIDDGVISADKAVSIRVGNGRFRVTPASGAEYEWIANR